MRQAQQRSRRSVRPVAALALSALAAGGSACGGASAPKRLLTFEQFEAQAHREPLSGLYIVDGDTPVRNRDELREVYRRYLNDRGGDGIGTRRRALAVHQVDGVDSKWSDAQALNLSYCVSTT